MTDQDLGSMYFIYNQAIVCRSSKEILFFKRELNEDTEEWTWKNYHVIN